MEKILDFQLSPSEAALWWLGQAGYIIRSADMTIVIDPYLSDSAAQGAPEFSRLYPVPIEPAALRADLYVVTHDHLDHLDPETIIPYRYKDTTWFVAPRQAAKKLIELGVPEKQVVVLHANENREFGSIEISGVFAIPTSIDVLDTTGYKIQFSNGRSVYHTSDTEYHPLVLAAAPKKPEVMLVPINGKWGNPNPEQAVLFAKTVEPRFVQPNHYDLMALNAENPEIFQWYCGQYDLADRCITPVRMRPFIWNDQDYRKLS
ncbi:MBL fold metallo-hydrolase [Sphingobacterium sp. FBM7-1]|uniref:MBL fold metallo-hydrolase n=1 Tax=Sphingobacterium sp. FBM7-1 TaxID=2886688 RepID=UPI001D101622|nr:MBL fold metallo-hydrolase [Sphingobacterium sp. FBM7-1]MCC2599904.1 MBL fold metallo-hydrolase [Sphingobacterium sp. FBM7-1]